MQSEASDVKISKRKVLSEASDEEKVNRKVISEASDERKTDEMLTYGIELYQPRIPLCMGVCSGYTIFFIYLCASY